MLAIASGCAPAGVELEAAAALRPPSFDGADYDTPEARIAHGKRIDGLLLCSGCHGADYTGQDFGALFPVVAGLWATNITLTIPQMTDEELEALLRKGAHPSGREIYVMPSKQSQFLSAPDMAALIAYLRTTPATGEPTPIPPADFESAVAARLPDDYWLFDDPGQSRTYHNSAEEVAYYASHQLPDLGATQRLALGRYIASATCSACHGAQLDGVGEPDGNIQGALAYNAFEFDRLLVASITRDGRPAESEWGIGHDAFPLTQRERAAAFEYVAALAKSRAR